jgi:hypothetical protein
MVNYNDKTFRTIANSENGEVNNETVFYYQQQGFLVSATYSGGPILFGHLVGLVDANGVMDIRYHHVNDRGDLMTGVCYSVPELLDNGKIRLHEKWKWTSGDGSEGESIVEEIETAENI